jgi:hypothetical protein
MKIDLTRPPAEFTPITITLVIETQAEADMLWAMTGRDEDIPNAVEREIDSPRRVAEQAATDCQRMLHNLRNLLCIYRKPAA